MDDLRALRAGTCQEDDKQKCLAEFGADNLAWTCTNCPKQRTEDLKPYTLKLLRLRRLQKAGYPFRADDLALEDWLDLGLVNECLETQQTYR